MTLKERSDTRIMDAEERSLDRFVVHVASGADSGVARASDGPELSIGKGPGNHLVLSDPAVSRHHCTIFITPRGLAVRDLGSTNGTKVDGVRVETAYLRARSMISIGDTVLVVHELADKLRQPMSTDLYFGPLLGRSDAMRRMFAALPRVAASDSTVLIEGETGTGKSLLALAIHQSGPRADGPFMVVDCAATPPSMIERELFDPETGAFAAARDGTLFLDEIGELPASVQPKLLRLLESREHRHLGSVDRARPEVRVIAASNRDLRLLVNRQSFRSDLFYRLNILRLWIPPLRERAEDIALLLGHFWEELGGRGAPAVEMVEAFSRQSWPGNVRELRTAVERALLLDDARLSAQIFVSREGDGGVEEVGDQDLPFRQAKEVALAKWEKKYLASLMARFEGNISRASRGVRMDRNHLRDLLRRYGVPGGEVSGTCG